MYVYSLRREGRTDHFLQLVYLIVVTSTGAAAIPTISLVMIAAVYGLQALIFILKREFMLVGWMVVYILS
jgi:chitin synthase